jgi:hypothetical protein
LQVAKNIEENAVHPVFMQAQAVLPKESLGV